jgi:hypothetical protein
MVYRRSCDREPHGDPTRTNNDKQTGDEYVQLDLDKATAAINADFEEEMQDCTDTEAHGAVAEGRVSNKRHANEDLDELVAKEKQRRAALGINSDDDDY